ncbi:(2Fe-2S)-binding protein [Streptomyces sp. YIM S03343]
MDLDPELMALRPIGGYFVLPTTGVPRTPLPTLHEVYEGGREKRTKGEKGQKSDVYSRAMNMMNIRTGLVADRLRTPEPRVAASIVHQGLAARLWSVALGCACLYGRLPDLDPRLLTWDPTGSAPDDLRLTEVRPLPGDPPADAAVLAAAVLHAHLEPLTALLHTHHRLPLGLLRGNTASALAGTARELLRRADARRGDVAKDVAERARTLTTGLFTHPLLAPTGTFTPATAAFRRRSCCLYYRVPGGGLCGDCCLTRPPSSSPHATPG